MKRLIAALGLMLLASPAFAITQISTAPITAAGANHAACQFTNVSSKPITVDVTIFEGTGMVLRQSQFDGVGPFQSNGIENTPSGATEFLSCVFLFSGSAKNIRAGIVIMDGAESPLAALPAN
jgi:hypothetical protein